MVLEAALNGRASHLVTHNFVDFRVAARRFGLKISRPSEFLGGDETMSRSTYPLKLPDSTKKAAQRLAKEDGVSLNQWISVAVAQKVGVVETAAEFFVRRSRGASGQALLNTLKNVPTRPPDPGDEID